MIKQGEVAERCDNCGKYQTYLCISGNKLLCDECYYKVKPIKPDSVECKEHLKVSICFTCPNCNVCIHNVSAAFAKMVVNDLLPDRRG